MERLEIMAQRSHLPTPPLNHLNVVLDEVEQTPEEAMQILRKWLDAPGYADNSETSSLKLGGVETAESAGLRHGDTLPKERIAAKTPAEKPAPKRTQVRKAPVVVPPPPAANTAAAEAPSFFSRLFASEEKAVRTPIISKGAALALAGASVAIMLGAVFSARKTEHELRELEQSGSPQESWSASLQAERQQAAMRDTSNITNL